MRILRPATEDEVVAAFLRVELDSGRYGPLLRRMLERDGVDENVLARPDVGDPAANRYRRTLLDEHRGFERRIGLFEGFPARVDWYRAAFSADEVLSVRYIDWDWWLTVSGGSRSAVDAAERESAAARSRESPRKSTPRSPRACVRPPRPS
jgi:hypothetical protein